MQMQIHNLASEFVENYEPTLSYLENFFAKHEASYHYYFSYHCKRKEEKMQLALERHPLKLADIRKMCEAMPLFIQEIVDQYEVLYPIHFTKDVHLLVGIYGSNAYTHRQFDPEITFCLEKLSAEEDHLKVIIAHEFGHATHHLLSIRENVDMYQIEWTSPYTWLLQEGCATYLSTKVVNTHEDVYFAFERDAEWLKFCQDNENMIVNHFIQEIQTMPSDEIFKEWFSINGGERFGKTRLGYYIGYVVVSRLIELHGEFETITMWKHTNLKEIILEQLKKI